jgi:hypothetical protein
MEIQTRPICPDGSHARWARFSDDHCNNGIPDPELEMLELRTEFVGLCMIIKSTGSPTAKDIGSMAFWCDGVKPESTPSASDEKSKPGTPEIEDEDNSQPGNVNDGEGTENPVGEEPIEKPVKEPAKEPARKNGGGGILQFLFFIFMFSLVMGLMLLLTVLTWICKYGGSVGKVFEFVGVSYNFVCSNGVNTDCLVESCETQKWS